jgi:large subunit ribosomal protein L2
MAVKTYVPYTPSRRTLVGYDFSDLTASKPEKSLTVSLGRTAGRNNQGRVTSRFRGGGHKRLYRLIDFRGYDKLNIPAKVVSVEYDPYRTARIVLLQYGDGEKRYQLAWKGAHVGDTIITGPDAKILPGNRKHLKDIPDGFTVYNLEVTPNTKWKLLRSAGMAATLMGRDEQEGIVYIKLPSGEVRKFHEHCYATIWVVSNEEHKNIVIGKAGRSRWLGRKGRVLGKSMNPVDHPHGWWEGHTDISLKAPKAFNGRNVAPGKKTRSSKKWSSGFIVTRRKNKAEKKN